jgi:MerR family transcriptional regulator, copper efflux regulator
MRITAAAQALGTSARMLRYRESLGLLPRTRQRRPGPGDGAGHRQFTEGDVAAVALGLAIEQRHDISPAALAFGIRVLADPRVRAEVAELGRRLGRIAPPPARALDFEQERALRLMRLDQPGAVSPRRPGGPA